MFDDFIGKRVAVFLQSGLKLTGELLDVCRDGGGVDGKEVTWLSQRTKGGVGRQLINTRFVVSISELDEEFQYDQIF